jgi:ribonuclease Z
VFGGICWPDFLAPPLMQLTITGYSTALFSTWYFIDELGLLFDAGDGLMAALLHKSRKIRHVFISHADRDHVTGLLQLNQLNARDGWPVICYPRDSLSFPALETFTKSFDPHVTATTWKPLANGERMYLRDDLYVEAIENGHVRRKEGAVKSLSYKVFQTKRKLKQEFHHLTGEEIRQLSLERGKDFVTREVATCILGYSGDTPVEDPERWNDCDLLIHEATFLDHENLEEDPKQRNHHSRLEDVISMVSQLRVGKLILGHFSSRYTSAEIDQCIVRLCTKYGLQLPVYRLLPGEMIRNILSTAPVHR